LRVRVANVEREPIPAPDRSYGLVMFTEVLEHIAVTDPSVVLGEIRRILTIGGRLILSTPNVANVSNILALARGENIFWPPPIFYGGLDRHNREYTPAEVCAVLERSGFGTYEIGYMNAWSNWHHVTGPLFHHLQGRSARALRLASHPLFNNTVFAVATRTE
jgi:2-polyprenyl-3-methyl-5-hydroxy-6-metoxy-1,4-benzoquinol methylase